MRPLDTVPMPARVARLPRNEAGYPIPWFVAHLPDGARDFRIMGQEQFLDALRFQLCWICGQPRGRYVTFVIGPMCAVNRISGEPPSHRDCAEYAAQVCPFLSRPDFVRRPRGKPVGTVPAAGYMLTRNPGVGLLWTTRAFTPFRAGLGQAGLLMEIGEPTGVSWWREGRPATRAEVLESIDSGMPLLRDACQEDDDPAESLQILDGQYARALALLPAERAA